MKNEVRPSSSIPCHGAVPHVLITQAERKQRISTDSPHFLLVCLIAFLFSVLHTLPGEGCSTL